MLASFSILGKHMVENHPDSTWFGDTVRTNLDSGRVTSQICQICGKELVQPEPNALDEPMQSQIQQGEK